MDFPESTCPMTTMLMCVFSFPMLLLGYAGLAGAGGAGEGGGNAAAFLGGRLRGEKSQERQKEPPLCQPPPSPWGKAVLPSPHLPAGPCARRCPVSSGRAGSEPACPGGGQPGYFGLPRPASKSRQDAVFIGILPSSAETPSSQRYVIDASKVPFPPGKPSRRSGDAPAAAFSLFPNARASPACPGRSRGCPSSRAAPTAPQLGTVQVTTERLQNGADKNSPRLLPQAGLEQRGCPGLL